MNPKPQASTSPPRRKAYRTHPLCIGLYLFDFRPEFRDDYGHGRQFGVMADEVRAVMPATVSIGPRGHAVVDYAMLGVRRSVDER